MDLKFGIHAGLWMKTWADDPAPIFRTAAEIGFDLQDLKTGGGSDGNFTGALGIPTLDGLGADGHGAHSNDEYIYYSSLVERCRLMVRLMETLD